MVIYNSITKRYRVISTFLVIYRLLFAIFIYFNQYRYFIVHALKALKTKNMAIKLN